MRKREKHKTDLAHSRGNLVFFRRVELLSFIANITLFIGGSVCLGISFFIAEMKILRYVAIIFFVLFFATAITRYIFERRLVKEIDMTGDAISEQLNSYAKGTFAFERRRLHSNLTRNLLARFNDSLTSFSAILAKGLSKEEEEKKNAIARFLNKEEFEGLLPERVLNNLSYRSSLIAISIVSKQEDVPEEIVNSLYEELRLRNPSSMIGRYDTRTLLIYIDEVTDFISFQNTWEGFVSGFAITVPKKNSERIEVYGISLSASIYPFVALPSLISHTIENLHKGRACIISFGDGKIYSPTLQNESTRRIVALANIELLNVRLLKSKNYEEQMSVLNDIIRFYGTLIGFNVGGIYIKDQRTAYFDYLLERGKTGVKGLTAFGTHINQDVMKPFIDAGFLDFPFFSNNAKGVRGPLANAMRSLSFNSLFLVPIVWQNTVYGLLYFFAEEKIEMPLLYREKLNELAPILTSAILSIQMQEQFAGQLSILNTLASKTHKYMYTVEKENYVILNATESLSSKVPEAKPGAVCYKALFGRDEPCVNCPLSSGAGKVIVSSLGHNELTRSVLTDRTSGFLPGATILMEEETSTSSLSSNSLLDKTLQIRNAKAFAMDLNRDIRVNMRGYMFAFRLINKDEIIKDAVEASFSASGLMSSITRELISYGYEGMLYLYDGLTFVMKLSGSRSKTDLYALIEEIMGNIKGPLYVGNTSFSPKYACSLVSYPNEAGNSFEAMALIKSELARSEELGVGRVTEVGRSHARGALREDYILDLIRLSTRTRRTNLSIDPIVSIDKGNIEGAYISPTFKGDSGERIHTREWSKVAEEASLNADIDFTTLSTLGEYFTSNKESTFTINRNIRFIFQVSGATVLHSEFVSRLTGFLNDYRFYPGTIAIAVTASFVEENSDLMSRIISSFRSGDVSWWLVSYKATSHLTAQMIKKIGFNYIKFSEDMVYDARSSESETTAFIRRVAEFAENGFTIACNGIESEELRLFLKGLEISYGQGDLYGTRLSEADYIAELSYDNK